MKTAPILKEFVSTYKRIEEKESLPANYYFVATCGDETARDSRINTLVNDGFIKGGQFFGLVNSGAFLQKNMTAFPGSWWLEYRPMASFKLPSELDESPCLLWIMLNDNFTPRVGDTAKLINSCMDSLCRGSMIAATMRSSESLREHWCSVDRDAIVNGMWRHKCYFNTPGLFTIFLHHDNKSDKRRAYLATKKKMDQS